MRENGNVDRLLLDGLGREPANEWRLSEFHSALKEGQARIVVQTRPGSQRRRVLQVLHEPRGFAFGR